jgi:hypothetical protein
MTDTSLSTPAETPSDTVAEQYSPKKNPAEGSIQAFEQPSEPENTPSVTQDMLTNAPERSRNFGLGFARQFVFEPLGELVVQTGKAALLNNDPANEFGFDAMPQQWDSEKSRQDVAEGFGQEAGQVKGRYLDHMTRFYGGDPQSLANTVGRITAGITDLALLGKGTLSGARQLEAAIKNTRIFQDTASQAVNINRFAKSIPADDLAKWVNGTSSNSPEMAFANVADDLTPDMVKAIRQNLQSAADNNKDARQALNVLEAFTEGQKPVSMAQSTAQTVPTSVRDLTPEELSSSGAVDSIMGHLDDLGDDLMDLIGMTKRPNGMRAASLPYVNINPMGFGADAFKNAQGTLDGSELLARMVRPDTRDPHPVGINGIPALTPDELSEPIPVRAMDMERELAFIKTAEENYNAYLEFYNSNYLTLKTRFDLGKEAQKNFQIGEAKSHYQTCRRIYNEHVNKSLPVTVYQDYLPPEKKEIFNKIYNDIEAINDSIDEVGYFDL